MLKKILSVVVTSVVVLVSSVPVFAQSTNSTSNQSYQQVSKNQSVDDKRGNSVTIKFSVPVKSESSGIHNNVYYNETWDLTEYDSGTLICRDETRAVTYECNWKNSCVGDGYSNSQDEVGCLQGLLDKLGAGLAGDGIWGPATRYAVTTFQRANSNRLSVDGIAGPQTFNWLVFRAFASKPSPSIIVK